MFETFSAFLGQAEGAAKLFTETQFFWAYVIAIGAGCFMAWSIGANDVANAMGTSVGSGALTLRNAIIVAAIFEFLGAFFVGQHVSETIRKGILPLDELEKMTDADGRLIGANLYVYGMMGAILAAATWLLVATYFGLPVSTTHSIVGSVLGFGMVIFWDDLSVIEWTTVGKIVSSWLVDRLVPRDPRWAAWIPAIGGVSMVPFSVGFVLAEDPNVGLGFYGVQVVLSTFWLGPAFSTAQGLARLRMRSTAAALFLLVINVIGFMLFPAAVGAMSDAFADSSGGEGLRYALLVLALSNLWGALHSLRVGRTLRADLEAAVE